MTNQIHRVAHIPLALPERQIYSRLGANRHLTVISDEQRRRLGVMMQDAFSLCRPRGIWLVMPLAGHWPDRVVLADGSEFPSRALATLVGNASSLWIAAVSVGADLTAAVHSRCDVSDGVAALVYDAVGGETADAAMGWIQQFSARELLRRGQHLADRRFSPGYSDLDLSAQRTIFNLLDLENWGLALNEAMLMVPEKSVTALAGIENKI